MKEGRKDTQKYIQRWCPPKNIFSKRYIIFPLHQRNHWFLGFFNNVNSQFTILDPYIKVLSTDSKYYRIEKEAKEKLLKSLKTKHLNILKIIANVFIIPHQKTFGVDSMKTIDFVIKLPPQIPAQLNQYNCGAFLLEFAKHLCLGSSSKKMK